MKIISYIYKIEKYFFLGLKVVLFFVPKNFYLGLKHIFTNKKQQFTVSKIMFILSIGVYLCSVFVITRWYFQGEKTLKQTEELQDMTNITEPLIQIIPIDPTEQNTEEISEDTTPSSNSDYWSYASLTPISVDFDSLLQKNEDTVAWLKINNTRVNYPIVQAKDNDYYLTHSFNKNENQGGWLFGDYRNNFVDFDRNNIIYGHNLINKTMFGSLSTLLSDEWLNDNTNRYFNVSTPVKNTIWEIFSIYQIDPEIYYIKTSFSDQSFQTFIDTLISRSQYDFGVSLNVNDKILTLSTCDDTGYQRLVVHAKLIKEESR